MLKKLIQKILDFWWGLGIAYDVPALAFYILISLAPLALGVTALAGIVFADSLTPANVTELIADRFPDTVAERIVELASSIRSRPSVLAISIVLMLWTSSAALGVIDRVMLRILGEDGLHIILGRLRMLLFGALFAVLLILGAAGATAINGFVKTGGPLGLLAGPILLYAGCLFLYRFLPKPCVSWKWSAFAALPAASALFLSPYAVTFYISLGRFSFGGIFAFIAILILSCYIMAAGLLLGAGLAAHRTSKK